MGIVANILQKYRYMAEVKDTWARHVFSRITMCGTGELGTTTYSCDTCGCIREGGATCGSRNCPNCGAAERAKWVEKLDEKILPVSHFHTVFTLPHELNGLVALHKQTMLDMLMTAVSETLTKFSAQNLRGLSGFVMILHTWNQRLQPHYHVHALITGGAFSNGRWLPFSSKYLFSVQAVSAVFRGIFLQKLLDAINTSSHVLYRATVPKLPQIWNVYCAPPYKGASTTVRYFGTYANRIAITDSRIRGFGDDEVNIKFKRDPNEQELDASLKKSSFYTLTMLQFISRFVLHILPKGFRKIRYGGLYASKSSRYLLAKEYLSLSAIKKKAKFAKRLKAALCSQCKIGKLKLVQRTQRRLPATAPI